MKKTMTPPWRYLALQLDEESDAGKSFGSEGVGQRGVTTHLERRQRSGRRQRSSKITDGDFARRALMCNASAGLHLWLLCTHLNNSEAKVRLSPQDRFCDVEGEDTPQLNLLRPGRLGD